MKNQPYIANCVLPACYGVARDGPHFVNAIAAIRAVLSLALHHFGLNMCNTPGIYLTLRQVQVESEHHPEWDEACFLRLDLFGLSSSLTRTVRGNANTSKNDD